MSRNILLIFIGSLFLFPFYQTAFASTATYQMTITNDWIQATHPIGYPVDAHFSFLGGGTHDASQTLWKLGGIATPGIQRMAETGYTDTFINEVVALGGTPIEWQHWFCPSGTMNTNCGSLTEQFTIHTSKPVITLTSMLGPSPDWFIGVSGLNLNINGQWLQNLTVPLALYDAGTEGGTTPIMTNPITDPFDPIALIAYDQITGNYLPSTVEYIVGTITFQLISVVEDSSFKVPMMPLWALATLALGIILIVRPKKT